jgi:hypothetical protein
MRGSGSLEGELFNIKNMLTKNNRGYTIAPLKAAAKYNFKMENHHG